MTIATAAILATFMLEWLLHRSLHRRLLLEAVREDTIFVDSEAQSAAAITNLAHRRSKLKVMENVVISYTFEAGIIFHSKRSCLDY